LGDGVEVAELDAGVGGGELPIDGHRLGVAVGDPGGDLGGQGDPVGASAVSGVRA
jgi:hypothetical protein